MTIIFNRKSEQSNRRKLRREATYIEKLVWLHIKRKQLGVRFLRQYSVEHFIIDFYCPSLKLALEIDGSIHDLADVKDYDEARQLHIEKYGIKFIRLTNEEILENPNKAFSKLESAIVERKVELKNKDSK